MTFLPFNMRVSQNKHEEVLKSHIFLKEKWVKGTVVSGGNK